MPVVDVPGHGSVEFPDSMSGDQISKAIQKLGIANPSDSIPKAKAPIPNELQGPAPSRISQVMTNLPGSIANAGKRLLMGPQMGEASQDSSGKLDLNAGLHPLIDSFKQRSLKPLLDAAVNDPIQSYQNVVGAFKGANEADINPGVINAGFKGAGRGAVSAARNLDHGIFTRSGLSYGAGRLLGHAIGEPMLGDVGAVAGAAAPVVKGAFTGARDAMSEFRKGPNDLPDPGPDTGAAQRLKKQLLKFKSDERGSVNNDEMVNAYRKLAKSSVVSSASQNEGPTTRPVLPSGRQVGKPGMAANGLETRPVPSVVAAGREGAAKPTNAPEALVTSGEPKDIHDQIAMEGVQKRAQDSRAKYEDVYQNIIKRHYTPEQLRNLSPDEHSVIDMKIKNMKHPEEHVNAGKKKYGTGLNPAVIESLAQRLESEQ